MLGIGVGNLFCDLVLGLGVGLGVGTRCWDSVLGLWGLGLVNRVRDSVWRLGVRVRVRVRIRVFS